MTTEVLKKKAMELSQTGDRQNVLLTDAKVIAFLLENCEITVPERATFFVAVNCEGIVKDITHARKEASKPEFYTEEHKTALLTRAYSGAMDFGHTNPGWDAIMTLGLSGLKQRVLARTGPAQNPYFMEAEQLVFTAAEKFLFRAAAAAEAAGKERMAKGIRNLTQNPPADLFEAMQLTLIYYFLQQHFDGTPVRTLGRLDEHLQPYYLREKNKDEALRLARLYLWDLDYQKAIANIPFALGGSDGNGVCQINDMSYILLQAYAEEKPSEVKLHLLCTADMPRDFLDQAMTSIKNGSNSLVFINDHLVVEGLKKLGQAPEDAARYAIVGCYEASGYQEVPCSCNARVNIAKALELTLHNGCDGLTGQQTGMEMPLDFETFEELCKAFQTQLIYLSQKAMELTTMFEQRYPRFHSSPFYASTYATCVERGGDPYCDNAAKYNNSSLNAIGLGTAVDALVAIKKLVYEDRRMTLKELVGILDSDWADQEILRGIIRNKFPKYGNGDPQVDALAADVVKTLSRCINGAPNGRGGCYRLGLFSILWRQEFGDRTAASADGRRSGETLSQNSSASFGADREGPTAHILSVAAIDGIDVVNGSVLDLELHASAVRGQKGTEILIATLETFLKQGGQTIHYNLLDTQTLRDAQVSPEKYPNLQVRMCGWNVRFVELSQKAQDEFIWRSELKG